MVRRGSGYRRVRSTRAISGSATGDRRGDHAWLANRARVVHTTPQPVRSFGVRTFVAFHVTRLLAGAYFLDLYRHGALPAEFALPAGWGDIAVGIAAAVVAWSCFPIRAPWRGRALLAWNTFGLIDIVFVLSTGVRLFLDDATIMRGFTELPLALLPTFVVPIVLVTHVLVFIWWRDARAAER